MSEQENMPSNRTESDVRRLLETIDQEYQAAQLALSGLNMGTSKHEFINSRMEKLGDIHEKLVDLVGKERADQLIVEQMERSAESLEGK